MSATNFKDEMVIPANGAFFAEGTVEDKYAGLTRMYVGVLQLKGDRSAGNLEITGAAYGFGAPEWKQSTDPENPGDRDGWESGPEGSPTRVRRWAMELRPDYEHPLQSGQAVGFVLGEMPGGRVTGWIESGLNLTAEQSAPFAVPKDDLALAYDAVLSTDKQEAVGKLVAQLKDYGKRAKDAEVALEKLQEKLTNATGELATLKNKK